MTVYKNMQLFSISNDLQAIVMIDLAIEKGELFQKEAFVNACNRAKNGNGRLHFLGLVGIDKYVQKCIGVQFDAFFLGIAFIVNRDLKVLVQSD